LQIAKDVGSGNKHLKHLFMICLYADVELVPA